MTTTTKPAPPPGLVAAGYKVQRTVVSLTGGAQQVLKPDPRRWFVAFMCTNSPGTVAVSPFSPQSSADGWQLTPTVQNLNFEFRKQPAAVTGAWFASPSGGLNLTIIEELFLG